MKIAFLELIHEYLNRSSTSPETALRKEYNQNMTEYLSSVRLALRELQKALLDLYGKEAPELLLYGSYARGDATPASDVDVLLLYPT
jgi:predicted nucleotidyltransferase